MMVKPMKTLELHYPMIQFLISYNKQLFTEEEVNSGGYLPSRRGKVNIRHFHRHWGE